MTSQKPQRRLPLAAAVCAALAVLPPGLRRSPRPAPYRSAEAPAKVEKNATTGIAS